MRALRVVLLGLGPIGRAVAREVLAAPDLKLVAAVDPADGIAGRPLAEVLRDERAGRRRVAASLDRVSARADVALHLAASRFPDALPQILEAVDRGLAVVSTSEELIAAPWRWPRRSRALNQRARERGVAVLAAGVNPGLVMDVLPAALANACVRVRSVRVVRHVDTARRRAALRAKTGAGLTAAEFRARAREGRVGHVGLRDSLVFLMAHLPLEGEVGEEILRPVLAKSAVGRGSARVPKGRVAGVRHSVRAKDPATGRIVARLDLEMVVDHPDPVDEIRIDGDPPLRVRFEGGVSGDRATIGQVLSTLRFSPHAPPGFDVG